MRQFSFHGSSEMVNEVMSCCGSLAVPYGGDEWGKFVRELMEEEPNEDALMCRMAAVTQAAVPEPGEVHPQRAGVDVCDGYAVFSTPGEVAVRLSCRDGSGSRSPIFCGVSFGRDSQELAAQMMAALALNCGQPTMPIEVDGQGTCPGLALARLMEAACGVEV